MKKARARAYYMRVLQSETWGCPVRLQRTLYESTVLSVLDWGAFIYHNASSTLMAALENFQGECAQIMFGVHLQKWKKARKNKGTRRSQIPQMVALLPPLTTRHTKQLAMMAIKLNNGLMPTASDLLDEHHAGDLLNRDNNTTHA